MLEMQDFADAIIGVPGEGLNIEQRKCLTIGVELAARPQLLIFVDEPTSGLDSQTSWVISTLIKSSPTTGKLCSVPSTNLLLSCSTSLTVSCCLPLVGERCTSAVGYTALPFDKGSPLDETQTWVQTRRLSLNTSNRMGYHPLQKVRTPQSGCYKSSSHPTRMLLPSTGIMSGAPLRCIKVSSRNLHDSNLSPRTKLARSRPTIVEAGIRNLSLPF